MAISITGFSSGRNFGENDVNVTGGKLLDPDGGVTLTGADFSNNGGILSIGSATQLPEDQISLSSDSVSVDGVGTGSFVIGSDSIVRFVPEIGSSVVIGTLTGSGVSGNAFAITIADDLNQEYIESLLERVTYQNTSDNPTANRSYAITLSDFNDGEASQTTSVFVLAQNDAPTITNLTQTATYTEGDASVAIADIVVTERDNNDTITATLTLANPAAGVLTTGAGGTYDANTGIWTVSGSATVVNAALAAVSFTPGTNNDVDTTISVSIRDTAGPAQTGTITLDVTPVNDAPVLTAIVPVTYADTIANDTFAATTGTLTATDVDTVDTKTFGIDGGTLGSDMVNGVTYDISKAGTYGTLYVASGSGAYTFVPTDSSIEALKAGDNPNDTFAVTVTDSGLQTSSQDLVINYTGTNDAPVVSAAITATVAEDASSDLSVDLLRNASDVDGDELSVSGVSYQIDDGDASATVPAGVSLSGTTLTVDADNAAFQSLGVGDTRVIEVSYNVIDSQGGITPQTATVTVTGTNDAPKLGFSQGFATDTAGVTTGNGYGAILIVQSGTNGITAPDGDGSYAVVTEVGSGPFTRFGGSSAEFVDNSQAEVKVYLDAGWDENTSFQYTVAANGSDGLHQRDFGFQVRATGDGTIEIGAASGATQDQITSPIPDAVTVSATGWYTLQHVFHDVNGVLSVDMNLVAADGTVTHIATLSDPSDTIDQVGGTRYGWFTDISVDGGLAIDALQLGDFEGRVTEAATAVSTSGVIPFSDVDLTDTHTITAVAGGEGYLGTFAPVVTADSTGDGQGSVTWTYNATPAELDSLKAGETVTQSYTVTISDGEGGTSSQVVTVTLTGTNDAPVAIADTNFVIEEATVTGTVATNDTDVDGDTLSYALVGTAPAGFTLDTDGSYTLNTANAAYQDLGVGETRDVIVDYTVSDVNGGTDTAQLTITVTGINDSPIFTSGGTTAFNENGTGTAYQAIATDADQGQIVTYSFGTGGADNSLFDIDPDSGAVTFKSAPDFESPIDAGKDNVYNVLIQASSGGETISKAVAITVADVATLLDAGGATYNGTGAIDEVQGQAGDDIINGAGGDDDLFGGSGDDTINGGSGADQIFGQAGDDTLIGGSGTDILTGGGGDDTIDGGSQDSGLGDVAVFSGNLRDYTAVVSGGDIIITDTRTNSPDGTDTIRNVEQFQFADGTYTAAQVVNDTPVAANDTLSATEDTPVTFTASQLLGNDTDADLDTLIIQAVTSGTGGTVALVDGSVVFTPATNFSGAATFTYTASDGRGGISSAATVTVNVAPVSDAPTLTVEATATGNEDSAIALSITSSLVDSGETLSITISGLPTGATLSAGTLNQDGSYTLTSAQLAGLTVTPAANSDEDFRLTVTASSTDGNAVAATTTDTIRVTVDPVSDAPTLTVEATATGNEDSAIALSITSSLVDSGETLSITISGLPTGATLSAGTLNQDGSYTLTSAQLAGLTVTPAANSDEDFRLTVTASSTDGNAVAATTTDTIRVTVDPVNDAPIAVNDTNSVAQRLSVTANVLTNDTDVDVGDTRTVSAIAFNSGTQTTLTGGAATIAGAYGLLSINADGSYTYAANSEGQLQVGETANERFTYEMQDGSGVSRTADLTLAVTGSALGNAAANVFLLTGSGSTATGLDGSDIYIVDNSSDRVIEAKTDTGIDLVQSSASYSLSGTYVENLTLTGAANINATGNSLANVITGNEGNNILNGERGADRMIGGAGSDTYVVDNAGDRVVEAKDDAGTDLVQSSVSYSLSGTYVENLTLTGGNNINATGNSLANFITGNEGNNILNGERGADRMIGGAGSDTYVVDNAGDRVVEAKDDAGTDLVQSSLSFSLGGIYVENLSLTGSSAITGTGNSLDNAIIGNTGNNRLDGLTGEDHLTGGGGRDTFVFSTVLRASNVDHITDFTALSSTTSATHDTIALSQAVFTALTAGTLSAAAFKDISATSGGAVDANDRILYDHDTGALFYDADGSGRTKAVQFATLDNKVTLTHDDFLVII